MTPTMRLRWYRPLVEVGFIESEPGEPVLQQFFIRSDREIEVFRELRGIELPKGEWRDVVEVIEVIEGDNPAEGL